MVASTRTDTPARTSREPTGPQTPVAPEAITPNDQTGTAAAAEYFATGLYAYVFASKGLTTWRSMSDPDCAFRNGVISNVEALKAAGESDDGAPAMVESAVGTTITDRAGPGTPRLSSSSRGLHHARQGRHDHQRADGGRHQLQYAIP